MANDRVESKMVGIIEVVIDEDQCAKVGGYHAIDSKSVFAERVG